MSKAIVFRNRQNEKVYPCSYKPIGSLYFSTNSENPSIYFGGTWERFAKGRVLVGIDENQTEFNTVNKTGGNKTHTLSSGEIPSHSHRFKRNGGFTNGVMIDTGRTGQWGSAIVQVSGNYTAQPNQVEIEATGGGKGHNNLQPYVCVYIWRRTA